MMRADLRERLLAVARGDFSLESGVTDVTGVTEPSGYVSKPLEIRGLRGLRVEDDQSGNHKTAGVTEPVTCTTDLDDAISEKLAIIEEEDSVPPVFREAWARFNCERPASLPAEVVHGLGRLLTMSAPNNFPPARWLSAVQQAIRFAADWAPLALRLGWTVEELFGLHQAAPDARHDVKGLAFVLSGDKCICAITDSSAVIRAASGANLTFYRRPGPAPAILAWELGGGEIPEAAG
jgi:hypothetical protein